MANNGMPSLLALLGLVAVAGYQNRDKLGQMLGNAGAGQLPGSTGNLGSTVNQAGQVVGQTANNVGGSLMGGLNDLLDTFRNSGHQAQADSWITPGVPTQGLTSNQVENAIGKDTLSNRPADRPFLRRPVGPPVQGHS
ncbi:uncharacterized protein YidB (DUF937 family) [Devosia sp. 2618]